MNSAWKKKINSQQLRYSRVNSRAKHMGKEQQETRTNRWQPGKILSMGM